MSVVIKFSQSSMTSYISDIVETVSEQITTHRFSGNICAYLKLFKLYVGSVWLSASYDKADENTTIENTLNWDEFVMQCLDELNQMPEIEDLRNSAATNEPETKIEPTEDDEEESFRIISN